jgi:hypothetical protein
MNLFERFFGNNKPAPQPQIRFGRYSDCYRSAAQEDAFDAAVSEFEEEKYLPAYVAFFNYLLDENEQNVRVWEEDGKLLFELFQGSKKVAGYATEQKLFAEARVAKVKSLSPGFMRRLLEENFELKFSRFTLSPDDEITIVFDTSTTDGSPYKLYGALKELAVYADKHDDLLIDEFEALEVTDMHVRRELPEAEKEIKYNFIVQEIEATFREIDEGKLNADQYPVAITYLLLHLCYKLDYLTKPEGYMMEALERIHRLTFAQDGKNAAQKNLLLRKEFQKLLERPREKFFVEMYEVSATFGITGPVDHQKVAIIIDQELPNMKWYKDHGHDKIALAIPGFIAGRCLFNFAVPKPDKDLFHLLLQIMEPDYFRELGFQVFIENGILDEKAIRKAIREIVAKHKKTYGRLNPNLKPLVFNSLPAFAESYLWMVRDLDLAKTD